MTQDSGENKIDQLLECLVLYTKLYHKPFSAESLVAGLPVEKNQSSPELFSLTSSKGMFSRAAKRAGLTSKIVRKKIDDISPLVLPVILILKGRKACILEAFNADKTEAKIILPELGESETWVSTEELKKEYLGYAFYLKKEYVFEGRQKNLTIDRDKHWFWGTLALSKNIYRDVLIASFLINMTLLASPLFTMNVYDRVVPNNAIETLWVLSLGILVVNVLDIIMKFTRSYFLESAAKKSDIIMSSILFEKVMDIKMAAKPKSVGSFAAGLRDFDSIKSFIASSTVVALVDLPFLAIFLFVIWVIGSNIVLIPIAVMIMILGYVLYIRGPLKKSVQSTQEASANKNSVLIESLVNLETIKTMGASGYAQWQWEEANGQIAARSVKSKILSSAIPATTNFLIQLNTVAVIIYGVYMIQEKTLTMGALIAIVMLSSRAIAPMGQVASLLSSYENVRNAYAGLEKIMEMPQERPEGKQFVRRQDFEGEIEFKNVYFKYPGEDKYSLQNVSFKIKPGEKIAFIGRIGSGKTTAEKMVLGLYEPTEGSVMIDGIDINQVDPVDLRKNIGYVPQDISLIKGTVRENIVYKEPTASDAMIIRAAKISSAEDFINRHPKGFDMPVGERGEGISGGQRQSIAIARAFITDAKLILMDEPTNMMDSTTEGKVKKNLQEVIKNKTLILVTHKTSLLSLVDRILVFEEGKLILDGPKDEVLKKLSGDK